MIAKFNPTGTHIYKGYLKVRIDLYPDIGDKTYPLHHIQVPVFPPEGYQGAVDEIGGAIDEEDYKNWIDGLPKTWQLNPALCHFINIDSGTSTRELRQIIRELFDKAILLQLDDLLSQPIIDIRGVEKLRERRITNKATVADIATVNSRFSSLEIQV